MEGEDDIAAARRAFDAVDVDGWTARLNLLADPTRLKILLCLHYMPGLNVREIADATGVTATVVSQSLRRPRTSGWVSPGKTGREQKYRLSDEGLHAILHTMGAGHFKKSAPVGRRSTGA